MAMDTEEFDDGFYKLHLFRPSKEEAVTHLLPRLLAGTPPLPRGLIRHADVYGAGREPGNLAAEYAPVPSAASTTGDRFFFTTCRRGKNGRCARGAGNGTWTIQRTEPVYGEAGDKVGELRHLSFKKGKVATGWVMEEYRCMLPEAVVADSMGGATARRFPALFNATAEVNEKVQGPHPLHRRSGKKRSRRPVNS